MKITQTREGKALIQSDDGADLFEIVIDDAGEPSFTVRNIADSYRMNGVRYSGAIDVRPMTENSVQIIDRRHPNNSGSKKLPARS